MSYGDFEAVRGISFEVRAGEVFAFLGPNGAGKTTTIEILEGYRERSGGDATVLGVDPGSPTGAWRKRIGLVLQECKLEPEFTVTETLRLYASFYPAPLEVDRVLELVGLLEKRDERIGRLSGGQQRRVDVGLGIIGDPELLFLDEPTTGFDPTARRSAWRMIEDLRALGKTIFLTTHYMDEAQQLADRVAILRRGQLAAVGTTADIGAGLGAETRISFRLPHGVDPAELERLLGAEIEFEEGLTTTQIASAQRALLSLTSWAEQRGVVLEELQAIRPTLEDMFLELTAESESADGAEPQEVLR
jgi:ABC-2 type transport system ATP-binding protein